MVNEVLEKVSVNQRFLAKIKTQQGFQVVELKLIEVSPMKRVKLEGTNAKFWLESNEMEGHILEVFVD